MAYPYGGEDGRREEDGLDVVPLVDGHLVGHVDALVGRHGHRLLVLLQPAVDPLPVRHRVPAPVEDEPHKVGTLQLQQGAHLAQVLHLHRVLEHLEDL